MAVEFYLIISLDNVNFSFTYKLTLKVFLDVSKSKWKQIYLIFKAYTNVSSIEPYKCRDDRYWPAQNNIYSAQYLFGSNSVFELVFLLCSNDISIYQIKYKLVNGPGPHVVKIKEIKFDLVEHHFNIIS